MHDTCRSCAELRAEVDALRRRVRRKEQARQAAERSARASAAALHAERREVELRAMSTNLCTLVIEPPPAPPPRRLTWRERFRVLWTGWAP